MSRLDAYAAAYRVATLVLITAAAPAWAESASSLITPSGEGRVAVRAERVPLGRLLMAIHEVEALDHLRVDPALRGERVTVHLQGISRTHLLLKVLMASDVDFVAWGGEVVLGDLERAVPFGDMTWVVEGPEPLVSDAGPGAEVGRFPGGPEVDDAAVDDASTEEQPEPDAVPTGRQQADGRLGPADVTPEMRAAFAALPLEEKAAALAQFQGRAVPPGPPAFDPAAIRAEQAAAEVYVTPDYSMVGESVTYTDPNFVPYKNRPEARARRLAIDVSTIP